MIYKKENKIEADPEMVKMIYFLDKDVKEQTIKKFHLFQRQEERRFKKRTKCTLWYIITRKAPGDMLISAIEQAQKDLHHMIPFIRKSKLVKLSKAERKSITAKAWEEQSFLSDGQCLKHARQICWYTTMGM